MAAGYSIDGKRVEFGAAFPAGKLVVRDGTTVTSELKLSSKGEWPLTVGNSTYQVKRTQKFMGPKTELFDGRGQRVPLTEKAVVPAVAAAGSQCAPHQATARYACARCGSFACTECAGSDLTHCKACIDRLLADEDKNAAAMAYLAPTVVMGILGGLLLGILGAVAGLAAVAIAKRTESKALKLAAAAGLYALAVVIWLLIVAQISR